MTSQIGLYGDKIKMGTGPNKMMMFREEVGMLTVVGSEVQEKIVTGLTEKYVDYWGVRKALKEAIQNIAYGVVKSGKPAKIDYDEEQGLAIIEDGWKGFAKKYLYIGESQQRDDDEGLGTFGEGWKLFLLIMAREGIPHLVETVGYSFFGTMEPTPHGTQVLTINIVPNNRKVGTKVVAQVDKADFDEALNSFAVFAGIPQETTQLDTVIKGREKELWICGVRIEDEGNTNPLKLRFAYHLKDRSIMNRDRSQINFHQALALIRNVIFMADEDFIRQYVKEAMSEESAKYADLDYGPFGLKSRKEQIQLWRRIIADCHGVDDPDKLVLPENDFADVEVEYRGYILINLPPKWHWELRHEFGFKSSKDVISEEPILIPAELTQEDREVLGIAKRVACRVFNCSMDDFPEIFVAEEIKGTSVGDTKGIYNRRKNYICLKREVLRDEKEAVRVLIHELMHWKTQADDNTPGFTRGFEDAILHLLGY